MPSKPDKGAPKDLTRRIKSKGLKKLKWFCQMCGKQCGDQNGFKRHCESESHQRQLLLFAENQDHYLKEFSKEFEDNFMYIFKQTFDGKRTRANDVYQEYIRDKGHIHMNATIWHTLGNFVEHLGETEKCRIEETEGGIWHIQMIDKEAEIRRQKLLDRVKQERTDDERMADMLKRQIDREMSKFGDNIPKEAEPKEFTRENEGQKITFGWKKTSKL